MKYRSQVRIESHNGMMPLMGSVWLRTGSLWCENLGNIPLWLPDSH